MALSSLSLNLLSLLFKIICVDQEEISLSLEVVGSYFIREASRRGGQCVVDARSDDVHTGAHNGMQKRDKRRRETVGWLNRA